eukprot:62359_1
MLEPIYSIFNLIIWSLNTFLWLIWWLFIIIVVITFIGFINVRFFTKNNAEFSQILKDEQLFSNSLRFQINQQTKEKNKSLLTNDTNISGDNDDIILHKSWNRHRINNNNNKLPIDIEKNWTLSKRMKTITAEKNRQESPVSESSPSESIHSISNVSVSVSQTIYNDKDNDNEYPSRFQFKLTPRIKDKTLHGSHDNTSENENKKFEPLDDEDTPKDLKFEKLQYIFNINKMQCFDDLYDYMRLFIMHNVKIEDCVRLQIQNCIENSSLSLKSFEKALLIQQLLKISQIK